MPSEMSPVTHVLVPSAVWRLIRFPKKFAPSAAPLPLPVRRWRVGLRSTCRTVVGF